MALCLPLYYVTTLKLEVKDQKFLSHLNYSIFLEH